MLITLICALLVLSALYCAGMWLWIAGAATFHRRRLSHAMMLELERQSVHLGLCFIVAIGLLALIDGGRC